MKKVILFLSVLALVFVSCEKNDVPDKGKLDPNAMIIIRPASGVQLKSTVPGLTALEIVEQTMGVTFRSHYGGSTYYEDVMTLDRGFNDAQRDLSIPALKMFGTDIITAEGEYVKEFIYGTDFYLITYDLDTIAHIPQTVINNARVLIEAAYNDENYTEVYRLFNEAFTFLPISE